MRNQCTDVTLAAVRVAVCPRFLTLAVLVCGCQRHTSPTVFVDPALATLAPRDTVFIAGLRIQQLPQQPKSNLAEKFARESGIDITRNLWEVLIPSDGKTTWIMLRGKFSEMGMEPRVDKEGAQRLSHKGYTILGDDQMAVLFLNPTTAVASTPAALRRIIDNRDAGAGIPASLQAQIKDIPSTNQAWFAGRLPDVGEVAGGIDFRSGATPRLTVRARTAAEAQRLAEMLRRLFDGVEVDDAHVKLNVPSNRLDDLISLFSP
jgi:hypothetical protein